ncbi:MAG: mechanosensitive ion channel family protein [Brevinema sp.]
MFPALLRLFRPDTSTSNVQDTNQIFTNAEPLLIAEDAFVDFLKMQMSQSNSPIIKTIYHVIYDNPYAIFLFIVLSVLLFTIILRSVIYLFTANRKKRYVFRKMWRMFMSPLSLWIGLIFGMILGIEALVIPKFLSYIIKTCLLSILLWIIFRTAQKLFDVYIRRVLIFRAYEHKLKFFRNKNILTVFHRTVRATWFLLFITILLGLWGVQLGPILAGLGIAGIVVGLALQDTLSHIVGGVSLMLDDTYSEGDFIKLETGVEGMILQIGYRSTKIKTFDEELINIPNGVLSKMMITNLSQPFKRVRVTKYYQTIAKDAPPQLVKELLLKGIRNVPTILNYPEPYIFFIEPKGSTYIFRVNFFVATYAVRLSQTDLVQQEIVKILVEHNIRFAVEETFIHTDREVIPYNKTKKSSNENNEKETS